MIALLLEGTDLEGFDGDIYTNRDELSEDISFSLLEKQDIVTDKHDNEFVEFCGKYGFKVIHIDDYIKSRNNINNEEVCTQQDNTTDNTTYNLVDVVESDVSAKVEEVVQVKETSNVVEDVSSVTDLVDTTNEEPTEDTIHQEVTTDEAVAEEIVTEEVIADEAVTEEVATEDVIEEVKKEESIKHQEVIEECSVGHNDLVDTKVTEDSNTVNVVQHPPVAVSKPIKEKKSVLSKFKTIFKRKQVELEELSLGAVENLNMSALTMDISRGKQLRAYLVDNGIMTAEQVQIVLDKQEEARRYSKERRFIELAVECGFISDVTGCDVLTKSLNKEVKPLSQLNLKEIVKLTKPYYDRSNDFNFVYLEINKDEKTLVVGHDLTVKANYYKIEERFADYKVIYKYFIEGTTSKILCRI